MAPLVMSFVMGVFRESFLYRMRVWASVPVAFSSDTSTGCGTQHLLHIRSQLAGHGPNNSSLFPPLAAVSVVAGHSIARPIALRATGAHPSGRSSEKLPTRWPGKVHIIMR